MSLVDDIKVFARHKGDSLDVQWDALSRKALADMADKGVDPDLLALDEESGTLADAQALVAVATYCQANGGFIDNAQADRLQRSYLDQVCHLMAHHNVREKEVG